jgi:hypothetical protein
MNERIKELANKAVGKRSCYMIEAEYIKFAELIVRATMQEVEQYAETTDNFSMYECASQVYPKFIDLGFEE